MHIQRCQFIISALLRRPTTPKCCPMPSDSAFICRHLILEITFHLWRHSSVGLTGNLMMQPQHLSLNSDPKTVRFTQFPFILWLHHLVFLARENFDAFNHRWRWFPGQTGWFSGVSYFSMILLSFWLIGHTSIIHMWWSPKQNLSFFTCFILGLQLH